MDKTLSIVESTANNASYADASKRKRADTTTTDATSRPASKTPRVLESDTEAVVFQTEIQGLKTHINELYKYIERKGLMTGELNQRRFETVHSELALTTV